MSGVEIHLEDQEYPVVELRCLVWYGMRHARDRDLGVLSLWRGAKSYAVSTARQSVDLGPIRHALGIITDADMRRTVVARMRRDGAWYNVMVHDITVTCTRILTRRERFRSWFRSLVGKE